MGNSLDRLEIEKRALKGRTFESEDGESQEGAAQITQERDIVINYHIRQILKAREELLEVLQEK